MPDRLDMPKIDINRLRQMAIALVEPEAAATATGAPDLSPSQLEIARLKQELAAEKSITSLLLPLANVGVAVRARFFEVFVQNNPEEGEADLEVIRQGHMAAHGGNIEADRAMILLGDMDCVR